MKNLILLDKTCRDLLLSETVVPSLTDAVRECMENSIDAEAKEVRCLLDLENLSFTVIDNGQGMSFDVLNEVGYLRYTSKILSLEDLSSCTTYGFRGQALRSIASISHTKIITKTINCNMSFSSIIYLGKKMMSRPKIVDQDALDIEIDDYNFIKKHGSVVKVKDLYGNLPVRRKQGLKTHYSKVIENIKKMLYDLLVINPFLTIKVQKKVNGTMKTTFKYDGIYNIISENLVQCRILNSLGFYADNLRFDILKNVFDDYTIEILIGAKLVPSSTYQRIYFNSKRVLNDSIFRYFNKSFRNKIADENIGSLSGHDKKSITYFGKSLIGFPIVIIKVKGPMLLSDRLQDSSENIFVSNKLGNFELQCKKLLDSYFSGKKFENSKDRLTDNTTFNNSDSNNMGGSSFTSKSRYCDVLIPNMNGEETYKAKINDPSKRICSKIEKNMFKIASLKNALPFTLNGHTNTIIKNNISLLGTSLNSLNKYEVKISEYFSSIDKIKMTKDYIKNSKVISQIDKKFILIKTTIYKPLLLIVDQHACDERIKVENYFQTFVDSIYFAYCGDSIDSTANSLNEVLKEKIVIMNFPILMDSEYKSNFFSWGLKYFTDNSNTIYVTEVPNILKSKFTKDHKKNEEFIRRIMLQHYYDIAENRKFKSCMPLIVAKNLIWLNWLPFLPDIIIDIINSKACRSAIKFGEPLTIKECTSLLTKLGECKFAFQCAHGRPSVIPFVDLS